MSRSSSSHASDPRAVNNLLHTLRLCHPFPLSPNQPTNPCIYRGEHFRHSQNLQRSRAHVSATIARSSNSPTLPIDLTSPDYPSNDRSPARNEDSHLGAYKNCPGPGPPKSWTLTTKEVIEETLAWRAQAVSLVLPPPLPIPPLTDLCLRVLAAVPTQDFTQNVVPYLPPHLRRDLVRYSAVHSPLSSSKLFSLYEPEGHADTELVVVGPSGALRDDYFIRSTNSYSRSGSDILDDDEEEESWDSEKDSTTPLHTLILMSTRLATSCLLSLPPSITRMALINLPTPIPLHRLPGTCPLLVLLDLSYNTWLSSKTDSAEQHLGRVDWSRWNHLRVLGLRACYMSSQILVKLNRGRWDDVEVIL